MSLRSTCTVLPCLTTQVDHLDTLAGNTTRKNQLAIAKCVGALLKSWKLPQVHTAHCTLHTAHCTLNNEH